jgi:O-acetyl-ADP-ribose deacetylase
MRIWIEALPGDITRQRVDAIVDAGNSAMPGGGVDDAIHRDAGPQLPQVCGEPGGCPSGESCNTPAFRLPDRWVNLAVGPVWRGANRKEDERPARR